MKIVDGSPLTMSTPQCPCLHIALGELVGVIVVTVIVIIIVIIVIIIISSITLIRSSSRMIEILLCDKLDTVSPCALVHKRIKLCQA